MRDLEKRHEKELGRVLSLAVVVLITGGVAAHFLYLHLAG